ncbi:MAG: hypothetical protein JSS32_06045 [Verrucomicrobia bacterium]|nr:hypothetical protein [Verrucomicrobiota bacterium]
MAITTALIASAGGIILNTFGGIGGIIEKVMTAKNWGRTHDTVAPAVADGIRSISRAGSNAIENAEKHIASGCSRALGKAIELTTFGTLQYALYYQSQAACKDNPNSLSCSVSETAFTANTCFLVITSVYALRALAQSFNSSKTGDQKPEVSTEERTERRSRRKELLRQQDELLQSQKRRMQTFGNNE